MKKPCFLIFFCISLSNISPSHAALRARYIEVDALVGTKPWGEEHNKSSLYMDYVVDEMVPGIWDGWSDETGFDDVVDTKGDLTEATQVQATYWVDSIGEPRRNSGCVLFSAWAERQSFSDPGLVTPGGNGEAIFLAGGIKIDDPGTKSYDYICKGGFVIWIDLNRDGVIDIGSSEEIVLGGRRPDNDGLAWSKSDDASYEPFTVQYPEAGMYKILVYYYHYSQVNYAVLRENGTILPASVFGKTKGLPSVSFTSASLDGNPIPKTSVTLMVQTGQVFRFEAEAFGNITSDDAEYVWDFDGSGEIDTITQTGVVEWHVSTAGLVVPLVYARRKSDGIASKNASFWSILFIDGPNSVRNRPPGFQMRAPSIYRTFDLSGRRIGENRVSENAAAGLMVIQPQGNARRSDVQRVLRVR